MDSRFHTRGYWLAKAAHGDQLYGDLPYVDSHVAAVVSILIQYGFTDEIIIEAAWLHDAVEDTDLDSGMINQIYGDTIAAMEIANLVLAVTGFGVNRRARVADILSKIVDNTKAAILKTADRIANMENAAQHRPDLLKMYQREQDVFLAVVIDHIPAEMLARLVALS